MPWKGVTLPLLAPLLLIMHLGICLVSLTYGIFIRNQIINTVRCRNENKKSEGKINCIKESDLTKHQLFYQIISSYVMQVSSIHRA